MGNETKKQVEIQTFERRNVYFVVDNIFSVALAVFILGMNDWYGINMIWNCFGCRLVNHINNERSQVRRVFDAEAVMWSQLLVYAHSLGRMCAWSWLGGGVAGHDVSASHTVQRKFVLVLVRICRRVCTRSRSLLEILVKAADLATTSKRIDWCLTFSTPHCVAKLGV